MSNSIVPTGKNASISFFEQRAAVWVTNATQLGISEVAAANLLALTQAARAAFDAAQVAQQNARSAVAAQDSAIGDMRDLGGDLIKGIRLTAEMSGDDQIYEIALLPMPKTPTAIPAVPASNLSWNLLTSGDLELKWDGSLSSGTTYIVERSIIPAGGQPGPFTPIGFVGALALTDSGLPQGTSMALYQVKGQKGGTLTQPSAPVLVRLTPGGNQQEQDQGQTQEQGQQGQGNASTFAA